ncbi:PREDICTED: uncharacterized protein LOC103591546 [Galeopterus variegatus]|uniref:Uncharacterized protein LOC103591546 n=1 Tax=Galeopterus variegatus TaxID=482537 RepID=A0ABM0QV63_GALVR|nr:PREDICTED: uncharacterized protein LOC103591546 [Galeopterus variegatus]
MCACCGDMEFCSARQAILQLFRTVAPADRPALLQWMQTTRDFDEFTEDNNDIILKNIAEDLRNCLPLETMLSSEHLALQKIQQQPEPTVHVDAFLYDEDFIDSLCEEGKMSRNYCMMCGSRQISPLGFISHSFSLMELKFIYHHVLPDLSGKVLVDVGSRLGTVLYGIARYQADFCMPNGTYIRLSFPSVRLRMSFHYIPNSVSLYFFTGTTSYEPFEDSTVLHADICSQGSLLQNADIVIMNNVFEYFLNEAEQARYVTISSKKSVIKIYPARYEKRLIRDCGIYQLLTNIQLIPWVEEIPLNYDVYPQKDIDRGTLEQIHLYKIL